ncbi:uncharacterized protein LOC124452792 [Xenia sp. Carnegie-2017]|uniref:uncharacterized protein LOC124452792 n=1 Tax=Xenia sp. Carnegie-2017 TaxID=2897299 RepID=UPI001F037499|nr:uncharacterized protein LOC124452792 [Xenia sp. Carnegie-2017]
MRRQNRTWVPTRPGRPTVFSLVSTVSCHKLDVKRFSVITRRLMRQLMNISTKEQLSVIVRMDKGESVIERQLGFVDVSCDRTATAISSVVKGWDDETLSKVTGLLGYLNGFLFCFLVHVFQRILEQSAILYSILQDKDTDYHYGMSRFERFKAFAASLRNDTEYCQVYNLAVEKVGPSVTRYDQRHNYKQMYFEILDTVVTMLTERFQNMERFRFLTLLTLGCLRCGKVKCPQKR